MKKFKKFIAEEPLRPAGAFFVKVSNGKAQLCNTEYAIPCATFGTEIVGAVIQGDIIVTTTKRGLVQIWRLDPDSMNIIGPTTNTY